MSDRVDLLEDLVAGDDLGPESVVLHRHRETGITAVVVVDNVAAGPAIGGLRMVPDVTVGEVARLARAMTLKNAMAGIPHGGAKSGIAADPDMPAADKEGVIRWFGRQLADLPDYIVGPDMGTDETCMAWIHDEIGRSVGLPPEIGGIPLDVIGATGYGLAIAADAAAAAGVVDLDGARVAVQGFGAVGQHAARFLAERGAVIVAISDSQGGIADGDGLDVASLIEWKQNGETVDAFSGGEAVDRDSVVTTECDILIPAARPDVITMDNVADVAAHVILQGANIPATAEAEAALHSRGIVCLPDFVVNAGGTICAAVEYAGGNRDQAFATISERIGENTTAVLERSTEKGCTPREAANDIAEQRVRRAMALRRRYVT